MKRAAALAIVGLASLAIWASVPSLGPLRGPSLLDYLPRYFALFAIYCAAVLIVVRAPATTSLRLPALAAIWAGAMLFRLPLLTQPPSLSDDVYRYLWDGRVQNAGVNPYAHRVDSPALDHLAAPQRALVNNPDMASPYLPTAQVFFALVYRLAPDSTGAFQLAAVLFDLGAGLLLMSLLHRLGRPPEWALIYLWNPLIVAEFAHGAHVDALMVLLMVAALWAIERAPAWSPILLALATLVKPIPALLAPALAPRWGWRRTALYGGAVLAGLLPYAGVGLGLFGEIDSGTGLFGATRIYLARWNFNGGLYHWLEVWLTGYQTEGAVPAGTPGVALARALSAGVLMVVLGLVYGRARAHHDTPLWLIPVAAYLLLTPTVHPWYLAPLAALLPLHLRRAADWPRLLPWLYFSASVGLSYLTYLDPLNLRETEAVRRWEYLPVYGLLLLAAAWRARDAAPPAATA